MSKARVIGACSAGSTIYHCNVNLNTAGGTKKQGLPFQLDRRTFQHRAVKRLATGDKRDYIFTLNQIGGIGRVGWYPRDGIRPRDPYRYNEQLQNSPNALTCSYDSSNTNYNTFMYSVNDNSYILFPSVSCDPSTISLITMDDTSVFGSIVFSNVTYVPNGPTNGHVGYVFQLQSKITITPNFYTTNIQCSTLNSNTLVISNSGSTNIEIGNTVITISGNVCTTPIKTIIYNDTIYNVTLTSQVLNLVTVIINENLTQNSFNGSAQCI